MKQLLYISIIFVFASTVKAIEFMPLTAMHESGSIVNTTFFNAGGALPSNASSMSLNPAVPAAWHFYSQSLFSVFGSYYNNNNLDFQKMGGGGSLALGIGMYAGLEYLLRNETDGSGHRFNRATLAFGTMIDDNFDDPLFVGLNLSFYNFDGKIPRSGLLPFRLLDENRKEVARDYYDSGIREISAKNNLVAMDLGIYQPGSGQGLSWGIVLENILGYSWNKYDHRRQKFSENFVFEDDDEIFILEWEEYEEGTYKSHNMLNRRYNSFLLATSLSIPFAQDRMVLTVPADVRFWGFMNKDLRRSSRLKHRTEVHSGLELQFGGRFCGRLGWAWIPEKYTTAENGQLNFRGWDNRFSGGFGVNFNIIMIDAVFAKDAWGAGISFQL